MDNNQKPQLETPEEALERMHSLSVAEPSQENSVRGNTSTFTTVDELPGQPDSVEDSHKINMDMLTDPATVFGELEQVSVNSRQLAVRLLCVELTTNKLIDVPLVNIENDDEAKDIATRFGLKVSFDETKGVWAGGLRDASMNVTLYDQYLPLLVVRLIRFNATRWDPLIADVLSRYFANISAAIAADKQKEKAMEPSEATQETEETPNFAKH